MGVGGWVGVGRWSAGINASSVDVRVIEKRVRLSRMRSGIAGRCSGLVGKQLLPGLRMTRSTKSKPQACHLHTTGTRNHATATDEKDVLPALPVRIFPLTSKRVQAQVN